MWIRASLVGRNGANSEVTGPERCGFFRRVNVGHDLLSRCRRAGTVSADVLPATRPEETTMNSVAWRWTFAILLGTAWNAIEPMIFLGR
jgi:hypothetical protein